MHHRVGFDTMSDVFDFILCIHILKEQPGFICTSFTVAMETVLKFYIMKSSSGLYNLFVATKYFPEYFNIVQDPHRMLKDEWYIV